MAAQKGPLAGVKVADFTWAFVGPITTRMLASYGAQVIKIESGVNAGRIDSQRFSGYFKDGIPGGVNRASDFNAINAGKLSLTLNLAHPKGVEIAKKMVAWADIAIENFAGGVIQKMGLGYDELKKVKPDIIMLSSCTMGQTGPEAWLGGVGPNLTARSGITHIVGWPDRGPAYLGPHTDYVSPPLNVLAIMAALDYRRRTGKGQYLDMAQYEGVLHFVAPLLLDYSVNARVANRMGNRLDYAAPHAAYRCRGEDRWCVIAVFTDQEWNSFCQVIGEPEWVHQAKFSTLLSRKANEADLDKLVEQWTINCSPEEIVSLMQASGVAAGILQTAEDLMENDPHLKARHYFWRLDHPEFGSYRTARTPSLLCKTPPEMRRAPLLGEHNQYVLRDILGLPDNEIADLITEGIIE